VQRPRDLVQVQLDELRHKVQGAVLWIAMAIMVSTRLWLGATVSQRRDTDLIVRLVSLVKDSALCRPLLLCFDGLSTYITACRQVFRTPLRTGQRGRPRLVPWPDLHLGQVIKQYARRRVVGVRRRRVQGSQAQIAQLIRRSQGKGTLNTAFIERLNATFRSRLALLVRRTRHLARKVERVEAAVYLVGTVYNFCTTMMRSDSLCITRKAAASAAVGCLAPRLWRPGSPITVGASWNCCPIASLLFSWKRQEATTVKCRLTGVNSDLQKRPSCGFLS